ncbi:MAG: RecX family transcriptional regulator [Bacteroidales bacterium]|nr:RecX family transcriptional regulator [Bacteroidales bacterium]
MDDLQKKVLSRLQNQCARREYCIADIRKKALKALDTDDSSAADPLIEALLKDGYLDESRYASAFARDKSALEGWGSVKIRFALRARGIPASVIDAAIAGIDSERAGEKLSRLLQAKMHTLQGDPQCRIKLLKYALSRGYEYDDVRSAVAKLTSGMMGQD